MSDFIYAWGQFIDHDLDLTPDGGASDPIAVPTGDPQFDPTGTGTQTLPFTRSLTDPATGTSTSNPLNQPTVVTSFLDGSMIYGSDPTTAAALRTFVGGQLKTSPGDLLPLNTANLPMEDDGPFAEQDLFMAGDVRANENIDLTAIQTLLVREHNRQAEILAQANPTWTDEQLYQGARQIVIAEIQSITFNEYLPALLGAGAIAPYSGYDPTVNPSIAAEFSEAAFRFGHSQVNENVQFLNNDGSNFAFSYSLPDGTQVSVNTPSDIFFGNTGMPLGDATSNPYVLEAPGVEDSLLKYLATDVAQTVDPQMVDSIRNVLFGAPGSGAGGQDLFALDIQRGRDVGLPTYNETRVAYGLPAVTSFSQITSNPTLQSELQSLYGTVDNVELIVGGLAEDHVPGSSLGPTFQAIIADQFERTRDGDRLWYQNTFSGSALQAINNTTLADIIKANSTVTNLQSNVFFFDASATPVVKASSVVPTFTVGTAPIAVDPFVMVFDTQNLTGATVAIANYLAGDEFAISQPLPAGISLTSNAAGVLTLSGGASAASYQAALQSVTFSTSSTSAAQRTVAFTVTDGSLTSAVSSKSISVVALPADPWQNPVNPLDVDANGAVTPLDALAVINYLNATGEGTLPASFSGSYYYDVNGDDAATPLDALAVINYLNAQAAGQPAGAAAVSTATPGIAGPAVVDNALALGIAFGVILQPPGGTVAAGFATVPAAPAAMAPAGDNPPASFAGPAICALLAARSRRCRISQRPSRRPPRIGRASDQPAGTEVIRPGGCDTM